MQATCPHKAPVAWVSLQGYTQGHSRPALRFSRMLEYFDSQVSLSSYSEEISKPRLGATAEVEQQNTARYPKLNQDAKGGGNKGLQ